MQRTVVTSNINVFYTYLNKMCCKKGLGSLAVRPLLLDGISYPAGGIQGAEKKTKPQTNFPWLFFLASFKVN